MFESFSRNPSYGTKEVLKETSCIMGKRSHELRVPLYHARKTRTCTGRDLGRETDPRLQKAGHQVTSWSPETQVSTITHGCFPEECSAGVHMEGILGLHPQRTHVPTALRSNSQTEMLTPAPRPKHSLSGCQNPLITVISLALPEFSAFL